MSRTETPDDLLADLPATVAAEIKRVMPHLRDCRGMAGRLTPETLKTLSVTTPAVLISRLRSRQSETLSGPHHLHRCQMAAFVLCKDQMGLPRDRAAARIAQVLLRIIPEADWGLPDHVMPAEAVAEEPLVSADTTALALALIVLTWDQRIALAPFPAQTVVAPEIYLGQSPTIGTAHVGEYDRVVP